MVKDVSWIPAELRRLYGSAFKGAWVDLNGDGKRQANEEIRTYNANNVLGLHPTEKNPYKNIIGDWTDWLAFYRANHVAISAKAGNNQNSIFHWAARFKRANLIHLITSIESPLVSHKVVLEAYKKVWNILSQSKMLSRGMFKQIEKLEKQFPSKRAVFAKLKAKLKVFSIYEAMRKKGIILGNQEKHLFTENLNRDRLDCDTSSFVILTGADEQNWPLYLVRMPGHAFVRWDNGMKGSDGIRFNADYGKERSDSYYRTQIDQRMIKKRRRLIALLITNRGTASLVQANYRRAINDFDLAFLLDPKNEPALHLRGTAKASLGQHRAAIEDYNRVIALNPGSSIAYVSRADSRYRLGQYRKALDDFNKALTFLNKGGRDTEWPQIYIYRAAVYIKLGYYTKAAQDLKRAAKLNPRRYGHRRLPLTLIKLNPKLRLDMHPRYRFIGKDAFDVRTAIGTSLDLYSYNWFSIGAMVEVGYGAGKQSHALDVMGGLSFSARYLRSRLALETLAGYNLHLAGDDQTSPQRNTGIFRYGLRYSHNVKQIDLSTSIYVQHEIPNAGRFAIMAGIGIQWDIVKTYVHSK